ncbi:ClpXP protease specificity-enhancing factor [Legionella longbeachae]|uniref:Putative stringent starvation protein B n=1 Tax=Legionella longbeachae serogroup 1 (strain NSW150) TaxID=661367 RepID=D3HP66_LEGLN|nr:ClpXP protease specificity-enhancing factor [Legionella longbeachae]VEE01207.1 stringent starvation protein B [Legionella oakridgensis]HBD7398354.1 ClpXP protease specificity-enhancing factor [Legionella pneumophila]ARB92423.1 ClpXP protease specificity-enhancing factor [Legionella longbeachae]ARM34397.1 ClpXP protease specificity-enhancing factor [Legionella longbeachae]EEZ96316.1 stringent starvation protein B [Legionella longbeachae D-4968]
MTMTSNKPYLIRAAYDWIVDNELTPYILVNAAYVGVQVPREHVNHDRIVLNISPAATRGLLLENDRIIFTARFSGKTEQIFVPPGAVLEIYAKENGRGIAFALEDEEEPPPASSGPSTSDAEGPVSSKSKPSLKLVK